MKNIINQTNNIFIVGNDSLPYEKRITEDEANKISNAMHMITFNTKNHRGDSIAAVDGSVVNASRKISIDLRSVGLGFVSGVITSIIAAYIYEHFHFFIK